MVRNTKGGTGTKGLARKHQSNHSSGSSHSRLPSCHLELIAICTKMLGNGMCRITTSTNLVLMGHIRNKFRGQHKRQNSISDNSVILVGLREWETVPKNCDILYIYDERELEHIYSNPAINIANIIQIRNALFSGPNGVNQHDLFSYENNYEPEPNIIAGSTTSKLEYYMKSDLVLDNPLQDDINIDDI